MSIESRGSRRIWLSIYFITFWELHFWGRAIFLARPHVSIRDAFEKIRGEIQRSRSLHVLIIIDVEVLFSL